MSSTTADLQVPISCTETSHSLHDSNQWCFARVGGFDQVCLLTGKDLLFLDQLDLKLWASLSCPTHGLEFDSRTLELIDSDADAHIRAPEILSAVKWVTSVLKNPDDLLKGEGKLLLSSINDETSEGRQILASARQVLANLGKPDATEIYVDDMIDTAKIFAQTKFNGDGIIPAESADDERIEAVIEDIITCLGPETDRSGLAGISSEKAELFFKEARDYEAWWVQAEKQDSGTILLFANLASEAASSFRAVCPKIDDFFMRCRLVQFDSAAAGVLNPSTDDYRALALKDISSSSELLSTLPIALVEAGRALPLAEGVNPAWADAMKKFSDNVVKPILGEKVLLTPVEWQSLKEKFAAFEAWSGSKQGSAVEVLGLERVQSILSGGFEEAIASLLEKDKALEPEATAIASVEKLVRYYRDIYRLLNNFISFHDFYTPGFKAIFQAGSLYMDGKCCDFCVKVTDVAKHSSFAALSHTYLAYCECTRNGEKMHIAAAFTDGDSDNLLVGRNGIFYDRKGQDWDATIVKILEHPISIRQAFWSPYKRAGRMIEEQIEKMAAAREKQVDASAMAKAAEVAKGAEVGKPASEQPFDVGKFAGIFAAIGLAIGAIGTAIAAVVTGFLGLKWWQMPLALAGVLLVISGPSMLLAYLHLRKRNLAPILDANGWAVNSRAMINIPCGTCLTQMAKLPENARYSVIDPFAEKETPWRLYVLIAVLVALLLFLLDQGIIANLLGRLF